jgi:formate/nitrite transporter FocA (FNT family)
MARARVRDGTEESAVPLRPRQREEAERRAAIGAPVVHEAIRIEGADELARPSSALLWSGLAAGLSMGFSVVAQGALRAGLPDEAWRPLVERSGYAVGFLIVVLGRQQLFTENTITPVLPVLTKPSLEILRNMLRLWSIVLVANLLGALAVAMVLAHGDAFSPTLRAAFHDIGEAVLAGTPLAHLVGGVFAGWLLATMVWLLPGAPQSRFAVIFIVTYVIGIGGFAHIVAGAVEALYVVADGSHAFTDFLGWAAPTLVGNIIGGVALVTALMHGQVVAGADPE